MENSHNKVESIWTYWLIYVLLMVLLIGTVFASQFDLGAGNIAIALAIAVTKALLVILFFMHVRHSSRLTWTFAAAAFLWLSLLLGLTMTDYATRGIPPGTSADLVHSPEQGHLPNVPVIP